jgi:hypothetical protein
MSTARRLRVKNYLQGPYELGSEKFSAPPAPENRWLPGDLIGADGSVVARDSASLRAIHGVLDLLNRTGQGFSPRGVPLYLCYPLNPALPPFLVAYKERGGAANILVTIQFEHWDSGRWPRGGIARVHCPLDGSRGQKSTERKLLCDVYSVPTRSELPDVEVPFPPVLHLEEYEAVTWDHAFNVDPASTEDVDDIFAWRTVEDAMHFMIAIADVAAWVPPGSDVDKQAYALGQTLYDNGFVMQPMLPHSLSTRSASLRQDGVARPVVGLVFVIRDGVIQSTTWHKYLVRLNAAHTYESVLEDAGLAGQLLELLTIVCPCVDPADTHDWVAAAMIKYNHTAAQLLQSVGLGVLRRQAGSTTHEYKELGIKSGCSEIAMFGEAAGEYCIGSALETAHSALGLDVYCHVTSPLRRYADLVNQRLLKYLLFGETWVLGSSSMGADEVVAHLNYRSRAAKWLERELWFAGAIQPNTMATAHAICLKLKNVTTNRWSIYVPAWRRKMTGVCSADDADLLRPGSQVAIRTYCDLRRPIWRERIVCQIVPE